MVPFKRLHKLLWDTLWDTFDSGCFGYAKEAAYSFILSFFPMLLFATALFAVLGRDYQEEIIDNLHRVLPPDSRALVIGYMKDFFREQPPASLFWFCAVATVFPAAGLMTTLSKAFDAIYDNTERRSFWMEQLFCYLMVAVTGAPLLLATIATAAGTAFEHFVTRWMGDKPIFGTAWIVERWAIVGVTVMLIAMLLYHFGPSRTPAWRHIIPGAVLASLLWILLTLGFGAYVAHFTSINRVYGGLGAGIVLLVWMYFTALVLMVGAVFNRQCEILWTETMRQAEASAIPSMSTLQASKAGGNPAPGKKSKPKRKKS